MDYEFEVVDNSANGLKLGGHCLIPSPPFGAPMPRVVMLQVPESDFEYVLNHEIIHVVLYKLFGDEISGAFDKIAFSAEYAILEVI